MPNRRFDVSLCDFAFLRLEVWLLGEGTEVRLFVLGEPSPAAPRARSGACARTAFAQGLATTLWPRLLARGSASSRADMQLA